MIIEDIGRNAGIVWRTLNNNQKDMSMYELTIATALDKVSLAAAIGWLARENKISINKTEDGYLLHVYQECYF